MRLLAVTLSRARIRLAFAILRAARRIAEPIIVREEIKWGLRPPMPSLRPPNVGR